MSLRLTFQPWGETLAELADAGARAPRRPAPRRCGSPSCTAARPVTAAALAGDHATARVGTSIALAFTRSPMITALEALDLDELSGGRFVLGLGSGVQRLNEDWHNVAFGKPVAAPARDGPQHPAVLGDLHHRRADARRRRVRADAHPRLPAAVRRRPPGHPGLPGRDGSADDPARRRDRRRLDQPRAVLAGATSRERVLPDLDGGHRARAAGKTRADLDVVVSACCSIDADPAVARRRAAGLVGVLRDGAHLRRVLRLPRPRRRPAGGRSTRSAPAAAPDDLADVVQRPHGRRAHA